MQYVPPKRWYLPTSPHRVTTQKTYIENSILSCKYSYFRIRVLTYYFYTPMADMIFYYSTWSQVGFCHQMRNAIVYIGAEDFIQNRCPEDGQFSKIMSKCSDLKRCHLRLLHIPEVTESVHTGPKHLQTLHNPRNSIDYIHILQRQYH
jgi:hypothetical protein